MQGLKYFSYLCNHKNNYDMKRILLSIASAALCLGLTAQPKYDYSKLSTERLDRGVVAVRQSDGKVFVSWRILRDDQKGESFDIYRNGVKLNQAPLTNGGSFFIDENPLDEDATYEIKGGTAKGQFTLCQEAKIGRASCRERV
mgnify:CR=1 FL=1